MTAFPAPEALASTLARLGDLDFLMEPTRWDAIDPQRAQLRALVAGVELEVARLPSAEGDASLEPLRKAWVSLVRSLDLGPEPELRPCPHCRRGIMGQATRCRYCLKGSAVPLAQSTAR